MSQLPMFPSYYCTKLCYTLSSLPLTSIIPSWDCKNQSLCPTIFQYNLPQSNIKLIGSIKRPIGIIFPCRARRRVRYEPKEDNDDEDFGYNEEMAMLEMYSQSAREEALLVTAKVDDQEAEVLIYKGFSSCLSSKTSSDPSKSVLPQRAMIKFIDRIRGPFDPTNIEYIEKGLTWETFKSRL